LSKPSDRASGWTRRTGQRTKPSGPEIDHTLKHGSDLSRNVSHTCGKPFSEGSADALGELSQLGNNTTKDRELRAVFSLGYFDFFSNRFFSRFH
tara:strand:+ start:566 stop:847 length:282 start_codon:yes stop_codon:yes gene_type:complete